MFKDFISATKSTEYGHISSSPALTSLVVTKNASRLLCISSGDQ